MEDGAVGHNFERDPPRFDLIWFIGFRGEDLNVIFYQNMPNLHNRYNQIKSNLAGMVPGWVSFKIMSDSPCPPFKMAAVAKNRNFFNCPLLLYYKPN
jgi:hypothetical protein